MLLHPRSTSWICGHDSVIDSDDQDYMCDDRWFHVICSLDLSCARCHTGAYFRFGWDIRIFAEVTCSRIDDFMTLVLLTCHTFDAILGHSFRMRFMDFHGGHMFDDRWFHATCSSNLLCTWCHTGTYFPFQMRFMDLHGCRMFDDRWFHVARSLTYHTFDAILGHITVLDEIYRSWWSCVLIPICETCAKTMIYSLSLRWFLSGASWELPR